ncbi:MAG: phosphonate metabolism protein/1,5-bisphosphokinase (PRPP-forming) PhnN [Pseudomonadota bacterium]
MAGGTFIAVVGPSGSGKDSLIRAALARRTDVAMARRVITRPADATEDFEPVLTTDFELRQAAGEFALSWAAHGLLYGISNRIDADSNAGRHVLANLSRSVIDQARRRFQPFRVVVVDAPAEVLAIRLAGRGREDAADIVARLERAKYLRPDGADVTVVDNGGELETAVAAFLATMPQPVSA